jgi:Na+/H+ antiporter NhaC
MAGVLGVATVSYLPYAFFNLLSPLISLVYGFTGFRVEHVAPPAGGSLDDTSVPTPDEQIAEGGHP